jgi:putative sigma-54 modulation protein
MTNNIIITGNRLELSEAMKSFMHDKSERLVRHESRIIRIRFEISMEVKKHRGRMFEARGIVEVEGPDLVASAKAANAYAAIELAVDKLDRKLRHRHRILRYKRVRPHAIDLPAALPKVEKAPRRNARHRPLKAA